MILEDPELPEYPEEGGQAEGIPEMTAPEHVTPDGGHHIIYPLQGMFRDWFLDYASYVILERAVPHILDGLKPVQRRILHALRQMDDGRFHKVANVIGQTMQYHPHGDASIGDALVQIGQKELMLDTQGNWGNLFTGDNAAAPRYIETRLSKFALEVAFNPKTTRWKLSYDGRNSEPVNLPVKFPLLLAQGGEGIAVGLASKILPHNFIELLDAAIACLKDQPYELFPDFPTGGLADCSKYNDGLRGGVVKVRARIAKLDKKTLIINDIPFGKTTGALIESILKANEKEKIKVRKIDDNTAENVEILVHLQPGVSSDKTIDALYAFTDCEVSISPNSCVIEDDKPHFMGVREILRRSAYQTMDLLRAELEIRLRELEDQWHFSSLERIFIDNRIYLRIEDAETWEQVTGNIAEGLLPFHHLLRRPVTYEDIVRLTEIRIKRISKFDSKKAADDIVALEKEMEHCRYHLANLVQYTIDFFERIRSKFSKGRERKTELRNFDTIVASSVVVANQKLYANFKEGFVGTGLKKDEFVCDCSDIDDILVIRRDGVAIISKVSEKAFFGKDILHAAVFKQDDERTTYNLVYRDGRVGPSLAKRFFIKGVTRDREYNLTKGTGGSKILYLSVNPNGEGEKVKIYLKPRPKIKKLHYEFDFAQLPVRGRSSVGNTVARHEVHKVVLVEKGLSTLGGVQIWFDWDVMRLNSDERGQYLGEFSGDDKILVVLKNGTYRTSNFDLSNHYDEDVFQIEKFDPEKVFSVVHFDGEQGFLYLKRFAFEPSEKAQSFINEDHSASKVVALSDEDCPRLVVHFGGKHQSRTPEIVEVENFIAVKGFKARGKRITTFDVEQLEWAEPAPPPPGEFGPEEEIDFEIEDLRDGSPLETGAEPDDSENESLPPKTDGTGQMILDI